MVARLLLASIEPQGDEKGRGREDTANFLRTLAQSLVHLCVNCSVVSASPP